MKKACALAVFSSFLLVFGIASASVLSDDFSADAINRAVWTVTENQNTVVLDRDNQRVVMTQHGRDGSSALRLRGHPVAGDFDLRVEYEILTPRPADHHNGNQQRIGLSVGGIGWVGRVSDGSFGDWQEPGGGEVYLVDFQAMGKGIHPWPGMTTTGLAGRLRLTRTGATISGYCWSGSDWVLVHTTENGHAGLSDGIAIEIWNGYADQSGMQIAFDNFHLEAPAWAGVPPETDLTDLVTVLQVLAGMHPGGLDRPALTHFGKLTLANAVFILRDLAGSGGATGNAVARVAINPGTVLLTGVGEVRSLSAKAYNAAGLELPDVLIHWFSSRPADVEVTAGGAVTARTGLGSALVTASTGGVSSPPVLVIVAQPVPGAVLLDDARVVGAPEPADPEAVFGVGWRYRVALTGLPVPEAGALLVGTGEAPVAGRVVSVDASGPHPVVELQVVSAAELFAGLKIDEVIELANVRPEVAEAQIGGYSLAARPGGAYQLVPLAVNRRQPLAPAGTRALGPFSCEAQTSGLFPLALSGGVAGLTVTPRLRLTLDYDLSRGGLQRIAIGGNVKAEFSVVDTLSLGFSGKVTCEGEILQIPIPIGGPAAFLFGGFVPVGAGFELGGELNLAQLGFELKATGEADFEAGMACPGGQNCGAILTMDTRGGVESRWITPDPSNLTAQLQLKPSLSGYGYAEFAVGPRFLRGARLRFVRARAGLSQEADLKLVAAQLADDAYRSEYRLSFASSVGTAPDLSDLCRFLNVSLAPVELKFTTPISSSPAIARATADVGSFVAGDPVEFTVSLDANTLTYLTVYNVLKVQVYRRLIRPTGEVDALLVGSRTAAPGQKEFTIPWTADFDGDMDRDFFAFVVTRFLPFPHFGSLELGPVQGRDLVVTGNSRVSASELYSVTDPRRCLSGQGLVAGTLHPLPVRLEAACASTRAAVEVTGTPDAVVVEAAASANGIGKPYIDIGLVLRPRADGIARLTFNPGWFSGESYAYSHLLFGGAGSQSAFIQCVNGTNVPVVCEPADAVVDIPVQAGQEYGARVTIQSECWLGCPTGGSGVAATVTLLP